MYHLVIENVLKATILLKLIFFANMTCLHRHCCVLRHQHDQDKWPVILRTMSLVTARGLLGGKAQF